ncbi:hypothetical protein RB595_005407 [Gaeumannomyces hyphopodioides]
MSAILKPGNTAVITGGASGIGLALAERCAGSGMKVLVVDWDSKLLESVGSGANISTIKADVSKPEDWAAVAEAVDSELGGAVSLLALNAGIGRRSGWDDTAPFREVMDVNFFGVVNGVASLLPMVKRAAGPAAVVITGSKQGITNPPGNPAYNASKAAVRSVAEHLAYDLRGDAGLAVHLLIPGWTFTGMTGAAGGSREKPAGAWLAGQVVDHLVARMDEGRFYVLCPDNDVSEETDRRRVLWSAGDLAEGRPPLTRWREEWKERAAEFIERQDA